jgi:hypothetical protein
VNEAKAEEFTNRMVEILNGGMLSLMISIGHRTGLFDLLRAASPSKDSPPARSGVRPDRYPD